jgi:hypothetical protein
MKPTPAKPRIIIAHVEGSGTGGNYHGEVCHDLERRRPALGVDPFASVVPSIAILNEVNVGNRIA